MQSFDRRTFLKTGSIALMGFAGLRNFALGSGQAANQAAVGFGPLAPDPTGILSLPVGFNRRIISMAGREMTDGLLTPGKHDGMGAFPGPDGTTVVIQNHELKAAWKHLGAFRADLHYLSKVPREKFYDYGQGTDPCLGGTTSIVYDTRRQEVRATFLSLAGTSTNCAGGVTPWNTWITCEETTQTASGTFERDHGYAFEVTAHAQPGLVDPVPLKPMGRFRREAVAVDEPTGIVYQTEDLGDGLIYRYIPEVPGDLLQGGRTQALAIRGAKAMDTRNWPISKNSMPLGEPLETEWVDLDDLQSPKDDLRYRGAEAGAAVFARGEGIVAGNGEVYICCTNGGEKLLGQVFRYRLSPYEGTAREKEKPGTLELFVETKDSEILKNCDNCCLAPWGDLVVAEDSEAPCRLIGITPEGEIYRIAENTLNGSELAGPCFSPDGSTLFVNLQNPGITLAITGPWPRGA